MRKYLGRHHTLELALIDRTDVKYNKLVVPLSPVLYKISPALDSFSTSRSVARKHSVKKREEKCFEVTILLEPIRGDGWTDSQA